jgi:hypothetical protein
VSSIEDKRVLENPSISALQGMMNNIKRAGPRGIGNNSSDFDIRYLYDPNTDKAYFGDGYHWSHEQIKDEIGLSGLGVKGVGLLRWFIHQEDLDEMKSKHLSPIQWLKSGLAGSSFPRRKGVSLHKSLPHYGNGILKNPSYGAVVKQLKDSMANQLRYLAFDREVFTMDSSNSYHGEMADMLGLADKWPNQGARMSYNSMHTVSGFIQEGELPDIKAEGIIDWVFNRHEEQDKMYIADADPIIPGKSSNNWNWKKTAQLVDNDIKVYKNPGPAELDAAVRMDSSKGVRFLKDKRANSLYIWPQGNATHGAVAVLMGVIPDWGRGEAPDWSNIDYQGMLFISEYEQDKNKYYLHDVEDNEIRKISVDPLFNRMVKGKAKYSGSRHMAQLVDQNFKIHKNPGSTEFDSILWNVYEEVRFLKHKGSLYAWPADKGIHGTICCVLGICDSQERRVSLDNREFLMPKGDWAKDLEYAGTLSKVGESLHLTSDISDNFSDMLRDPLFQRMTKGKNIRQGYAANIKVAGKVADTQYGKVFINPTPAQMKSLAKANQGWKVPNAPAVHIRGLQDNEDNTYFWDGYFAIHQFMAIELGLDIGKIKLCDLGQEQLDQCGWDYRKFSGWYGENDIRPFFAHIAAERIELDSKQIWENPSKQQLLGIIGTLKMRGGTGEDLFLRFIIDPDGKVSYGIEKNVIHDQLLDWSGTPKRRWPYCYAGHMTEEKLNGISNTSALREWEKDHSLMRGRYSCKDRVSVRETGVI